MMLLMNITYANYFSSHASYDLCFTPGNNCANKIIDIINRAQFEILIQAYNFTDISIAQCVVNAKNRGVTVKIILDKSQIRSKHSLVKFLIKNGIYPFIDSKPAIAHNKIIIIDNILVIGGSYNLSKAAAQSNAENITIIQDSAFAKKYIQYWYARKNQSQLIFDLFNNIHIKIV